LGGGIGGIPIGRKKGGRGSSRKKRSHEEEDDVPDFLDDIKSMIKKERGDDLPDIRRKGGKKGGGLTNGRGLKKEDGLVNGKGRGRKGKGLTNGEGRSKGRGRRGKGFTNGEGFVNGRGRKGRGRVNGLTNGDGFVNGRGRVNGLVNGMGLTNGIGKVNGLGLINGTFRHKGKTILRGKSKPILKVLFVILVFLIPTALFFLYIDDGEYIKVDGKFADWTDVSKTPDTLNDAPDPNVDIIEYTIEEELDLLSIYIRVEGDIFTGGPSPENVADVVNVFIDSDGNPETGYRVDGLGVDYMVNVYGLAGEIHSSGLFEYQATRDPSGIDWNAFKASFAVSSRASGSELELQVFTEDIEWTGDGKVRVYTRSWTGAEDMADYNIGKQDGALNVKQEGLGVQVMAKSVNSKLLNLNLKAVNDDVSVEFITLTQLGTASVSTVNVDGRNYPVVGNKVLMDFSPPLKIEAGQTRLLQVTANLENVMDGATLGFKIDKTTDIKTEDATVTLESDLVDYVAYVGAYPTWIEIDGAFGDWRPQYIIDDSQGETDNDNVEIVKYGSKSDGNKLSFYLSVGGEMMEGLMIPTENPQIITRPPSGPSGPGVGGPTDVPLPVNQGEDVVRILIDTDNDVGTGFKPFTSGLDAFQLGADYMLEMKGKNGETFEQGIYSFSGGSQMLFDWTRVKDLVAGLDDAQLETQIDLTGITVPSQQDIRVYFWLSDYGEEVDNSNLTVADGQVWKGTRMETRYYQDREQTSFGSGNDCGTPDDDVFAVAVADFDNDGDMDVVTGMGGAGSYGITVWENADTTPFSGTWSDNDVGVTNSDARVRSIAVADLDNDGDVDIVTGSESGGSEILVWENGWDEGTGDPFTGTWSSGTGVAVGDVGDYIVDSVATADFDNDGWIDIVSGAASGEIVVWENLGTPFSDWTSADQDVTTSVQRPYSVKAADLDNDGYMDIVSGHYSGTTTVEVQVWENDDTPFDSTWSGDTVGNLDDGHHVFSVDVADFDNDGYTDIVTGTEVGELNEIIAWENDGTPFDAAWPGGSKQAVGASTDNVRAVCAADIDNDGYMDIIVGSEDQNTYDLFTYENDHTPFDSTWTKTDVGASTDNEDIWSVAAADFDNDGDLDIVSGMRDVDGSDYGDLKVWENTLIHRNFEYELGWDNVGFPGTIYSVKEADLDNDGDLDLVTGLISTSTHEVMVWENDGDPFGGSWTSQDVGAPNAHVYSVDVGDLDNDGDLDIVTASAAGARYEVIVWRNNGTPFANEWQPFDVIAPDVTVNSVVCSDLDNDGDLDLVTGSDYTTNEILAIENSGNPWDESWAAVGVGNTGTYYVNSVAVDDLNNDGYPDIVSGSNSGIDEVRCWKNDGSPFLGGTWASRNIGDPTATVNVVAIADLDLDGYPDVVSGGNQASNHIVIYQNDGDPFDADWSSSLTAGFANGGTDNFYTVSVNDLDNDGDPDIVGGRGVYTTGYELHTWTNDGTPFNDAWSKISTGNTNVGIYALTTADFDIDGDYDIMVGTAGSSNAELLGWENIGAQVDVTVTDTAPSSISQGNQDDIFKIVVTHNGISTDSDVEIEYWRFKFYDADQVTPLDDTEMGYISTFELYLDVDNDGDWKEHGSAATGTHASPIVVFDITHPDSDFVVAQGSPKTYYFVVTIAGGAPGSFQFTVEFEADGYSDGYNLIENDANNKIVSVEARDTEFAGPVSMPEFHLFVLPFLALFLGFVVFVKRKRIYS
jgi:hypothetical protein